MPVKCPHCSEEVPNVLTQETHRERLKAKEDENKALQDSLKESQKKAKLAEGMATELATLKSEIGKRDAEKERGEAFGAAGIPEKVRGGFEALYNSAVASAEEGKAPTFTEWLNSDDTKAHPLLSDHFGKASGLSDGGTGAKPDSKTTKTGDPAPKPKPTGGLPNTDRGATAPKGDSVVDSPEKLRAYLGSAEYRAMEPKEQKAEVARLQGQLKEMAGRQA